MAQPTANPNQHFAPTERLFRRVHRASLLANGKPTLLAFELPDMSCNRELESTAEATRKGFRPEDWGVVAFLVGDIPPRDTLLHLAAAYRLLPRHIPDRDNFSHTEVRVWHIGGNSLLITNRTEMVADDPDRNSVLGLPEELLDPDFHLRWRKRLSKRAGIAAMPEMVTENAGS